MRRRQTPLLFMQSTRKAGETASSRELRRLGTQAMTFQDEGFDAAQYTYDNESPPEGEQCPNCGELLNDDGDCEACDNEPGVPCVKGYSSGCTGCGECQE